MRMRCLPVCLGIFLTILCYSVYQGVASTLHMDCGGSEKSMV